MGVSLVDKLPERYIGTSSPLPVTRFRLRVGRGVRDVIVSAGECRVALPNGHCDTEIVTDPETWRRIYDGRLSGIEAFAANKLNVRGSIEASLHFEPLFSRPQRGGLNYSLKEIRAGRLKISTLVAGDPGAPPLLMFHGLGATKASWLTIIPALARSYRVIAIDLPGFGASSKPRASYDAPWFAKRMLSFMDAAELDSAFVIGNSMGGRIAMELAMTEPGRVDAIACLCPAAAFTDRPGLWFARLVRPEVGLLIGRLPRMRMREAMRQLFAEPDRVDDGWYEAAIDDFLRIWKSPRARLAFSCALRNIYLDEPYGEMGFWTRLREMTPPALYIYGERDGLITHRFGAKMSRTLPKSRVLVWEDCGHVPQIESPERTTSAVLDFFAGAASRTA
jgi:pimeloyl-ACP methyl ester carboxylesterase